jgi:hypothetical protein
MVTLGCMPVSESVSIDKGIDVWANFGTRYFLERREIGMFNIGGAGTVTVDGVTLAELPLVADRAVERLTTWGIFRSLLRPFFLAG